MGRGCAGGVGVGTPGVVLTGTDVGGLADGDGSVLAGGWELAEGARTPEAVPKRSSAGPWLDP